MTNVLLLTFHEVAIQATLFSQAQILNSLSRDEDFDASSLINSAAPSKTCMKHVKIRHFKNLSMPTPFSIFLVYFSIICPYKFPLHLSRSCSFSLPTPLSLYTQIISLPIHICSSPSHSDFISLSVVLLHNLINSELALIETRPEITCTKHLVHSVLKTLYPNSHSV